MTIINTFRWNGMLGSNWDAFTGGPNPKTNWTNLSDAGAPPSFPTGAGDLAVLDLGGAISVTTSNGAASAEEIQIAGGSTVTFSSGHYDAGADFELGGMLIDEGSDLILTSTGTMADQGSLDIVGLTGDGTLTLQSGAGFDDLGMIIGADAASHGLVTATAPFGFEIAQSGSSATDGVLVVGEDGDGTVDISDTQGFYTASAIVGKNAGSTGEVDTSNVNWGGGDVTIGSAGTGHVTMDAGGFAALGNVTLGLAQGGVGDLTVGAATFFGDFLTVGADGTGTAAFEAGSTGQFAGVTVGASANAVATLTMDGATWSTGSLTIGAAGDGHATAGAGEVVTFNNAALGADAGVSGDLTIDAAALNGGTLAVGQDGTGDLAIEASSTGSVDVVTVGGNAGSSGALTIDDSTWGAGTLTVGMTGGGQATVANGATSSIDNVLIGPEGGLAVTQAAGAVGTIIAQQVSLDFGTLDVSAGGAMLIGAAAGAGGAVAIGSTASLTGLGLLKGEVDLSGAGAVTATGPVPGALKIDGAVHGSGALQPLMTLEANGAIDAGVTIAFGASTPAEVGDLLLDVPSGEQGTISGFGAGNTIDVQDSLYDSAVFTQGTSGEAGTLVLSGGTLTPLSLPVLGDYAPDAFTAAPGTADTIVTVAPCFAAGTRVLTAGGEVPVEALRVGDRVPVRGGAMRRVRWIGRTRVRVDDETAPVLVRVDAFAPGAPHRALCVSPDHAVLAGDVLVPVRYLANGGSIARAAGDSVVEYFHVELDGHHVLFAEGLPAESYLDTGNRAQFADSRLVATAA